MIFRSLRGHAIKLSCAAFLNFFFVGAQAQASAPEFVNSLLSRRMLPVAGFNAYDGLQLGVLLHNVNQPQRPIAYYAAPVFGLRSKSLGGIAGLNYRVKESNHFKAADLGINMALMSTRKGVDSNHTKIFSRAFRVVPYLRLHLSSTAERRTWIELRTFIFRESDFRYSLYSVDTTYYPSKAKGRTRYINQFVFNQSSFREFFPYSLRIRAQQGSSFYRVDGIANYFLNYASKGGVDLRLFASKFGYIGGADDEKRFETSGYQPKLTAVRGAEDYTYGNYFIGRNEFEGVLSQQIMMRDGNLKLRTDMFQDLQGRSDNWLAALNLKTTLPYKPFGTILPLRIFLDVGTHSELWRKQSFEPRFLYTAGIQLTVLKEVLNIYLPVMYSQKFREAFRSVPEENKFLKRISFSIDIQKIDLPLLLFEKKIAGE